MIASTEKESARTDDERTGLRAHKARKCHVDVIGSAGIQDNKLQAKSTRDLLHCRDLRHGIRNVLINEESDGGNIRNKFV